MMSEQNHVLCFFMTVVLITQNWAISIVSRHPSLTEDTNRNNKDNSLQKIVNKAGNDDGSLPPLVHIVNRDSTDRNYPVLEFEAGSTIPFQSNDQNQVITETTTSFLTSKNTPATQTVRTGHQIGNMSSISHLSNLVKESASTVRSISESLNPTSLRPTQYKRLAYLDDMFKDYDKRAWPTYGTSKPTEVAININVNSFGQVNAANMDYSADIYLRMMWKDLRLKLPAPHKKVTLNAGEIGASIWLPDIFFKNVKEAHFHDVTVLNKLLKFNADGDILYSLRLTLRLACNMSFKRYPLDIQRCPMILGMYAQTTDQVTIRWLKKDPIRITQRLEIAEFYINNYTYSNFTNYVETGNFSFLRVTFVLVRQQGYHLIQTYLPTFLLVIISWVSFWLNVDATPARVTLGVTTLLTLTTVAHGVRIQLPPVSYVKAIDVWIGACSVMVFGALLEFTLVNYLSRSKLKAGEFKHSLNILKWKKTIQIDQEELRNSEQIAKNMKRARRVDKISRSLFPFAFFFFNVIYWFYYIYVPDT